MGLEIVEIVTIAFQFLSTDVEKPHVSPICGKRDRNAPPLQNHNTFKKSSFEGPKIPTHTRPWGYTAMVFRVYVYPKQRSPVQTQSHTGGVFEARFGGFHLP